MSADSSSISIKREVNSSFSDHDYLEQQHYNNRPIMGDIGNRKNNNRENEGNGADAILVNFDNQLAQINDEEYEHYYNARGRERRTAKKPDLFHFDKKADNKMKKAPKTKSRKSSDADVSRGRKPKPVYEVEYIWGKRENKRLPGTLEYRVFWKNYPIKASTWEPEGNLRDCQDSIEKYADREPYFNKRGAAEAKQSELLPNDGGGRAGSNSTSSGSDGDMMEKKPKFKHLKNVLPTMRARPSSSGVVAKKAAGNKKKKGGGGAQLKKPPVTSIPPMPKKKTVKVELLPEPEQPPNKVTGSRKRKAASQQLSLPAAKSRSGGVARTARGDIVNSPHAIAAMAATVQQIVGYQRSDIEDIKFVFEVLYADGVVKKVAMRDLVPKAPELLANYLGEELFRELADD